MQADRFHVPHRRAKISGSPNRKSQKENRSEQRSHYDTIDGMVLVMRTPMNEQRQDVIVDQNVKGQKEKCEEDQTLDPCALPSTLGERNGVAEPGRIRSRMKAEHRVAGRAVPRPVDG
jgi:hypothetical protein